MKIKRLLIIIALGVPLLFCTRVCANAQDYNSEDIFEKHGSVMLIMDVESGEIIEANQAAANFYGYSMEELLGMTIQQINTLSVDEVKKERELAAIEKRNYFVFKHKLKDGTIRDVEVYSYPFLNAKGESVLFSIIHDITPRINAEVEVTQSRIVIISFLFIGIVVLGIALFFINRSRSKFKVVNSELQSLFENMQEGFALHKIICDSMGTPIDYRFISVNKSFEEITGLSGDEIKDKTVKEILPDTEKYWIDKYGAVALTGETISFTNFSKELNKYFSVSVYSPAKMHFVTMFSDITEQVLAKEKIALEKKLLETILEDTLSGYWDWNLEDGTQYLSNSFKSMFGYQDSELEHSLDTWQNLLFKEDLLGVMELFNQHKQSHGAIPFYNEVRYHHKDGSIVWVICSGRIVEWGINDKPLRMVGCNINITNLKELEQKLRDEKTLFQTTLHSLGDGVISTDKSGKIDIMNAVAQKLTGWSDSDAKGMEFNEVFKLINEDTREKMENLISQVFKTGIIAELEKNPLLIRKNGDEIPIEDSAAPIKDENGNISGAVVVFRDFTEKKEIQEKILYLSYHDQLTGLYNRRFFEEEQKRMDTVENLPFTIAMVDVNGLKLTNDAFGHLVGDELLKKVSEIIKKECRSEDIVARIGGDEFIILFPKTTSEKTGKIIKRIYKNISEERLDNIIISVSIGWDTKEREEQLITDIFIKAEENMYRKKLTESQSMRNNTIQVILQTLNEKNEREKIHSEKVSIISRRIGEAMKLDGETIKELEIAGLMHDIGKIAINEDILNKPGKLTEIEYNEIKRHPESSYQILKAVDAYSSLAECVLSHHERWDGKGYPRGLVGEDIPLIARIITVADSYEAMIANRPYKNSLTKEEAIKELIKNAGTQFDPSIVEVCAKHCWTVDCDMTSKEGDR